MVRGEAGKNEEKWTAEYGKIVRLKGSFGVRSDQLVVRRRHVKQLTLHAEQHASGFRSEGTPIHLPDESV
jgi:hypothetical protein